MGDPPLARGAFPRLSKIQIWPLGFETLGRTISSLPQFVMEYEDEFECQLKKQRVLIHDKENIDPHILSSPLKAKLDEISFFSSDFKDSDSEQHFKNLRKDAGDLFSNPKKNLC